MSLRDVVNHVEIRIPAIDIPTERTSHWFVNASAKLQLFQKGEVEPRVEDHPVIIEVRSFMRGRTEALRVTYLLAETAMKSPHTYNSLSIDVSSRSRVTLGATRENPKALAGQFIIHDREDLQTSGSSPERTSRLYNREETRNFFVPRESVNIKPETSIDFDSKRVEVTYDHNTAQFAEPVKYAWDLTEAKMTIVPSSGAGLHIGGSSVSYSVPHLPGQGYVTVRFESVGTSISMSIPQIALQFSNKSLFPGTIQIAPQYNPQVALNAYPVGTFSLAENLEVVGTFNPPTPAEPSQTENEAISEVEEGGPTEGGEAPAEESAVEPDPSVATLEVEDDPVLAGVGPGHVADDLVEEEGAVIAAEDPFTTQPQTDLEEAVEAFGAGGGGAKSWPNCSLNHGALPTTNSGWLLFGFAFMSLGALRHRQHF